MLTDHIAAFIMHCRAIGLSPHTIVWYESKLRVWSEFIGSRDWRDLLVTREFLADLRVRDVRYAAHPMRSPKAGAFSENTIRAYVRAIRRFGNWAVEEGLVAESPARLLKLPRAPKLIPRGITADDFEKLLAAATTPRDRALLFVLRDTGCRAAEIAGLRIGDLDLERGTVKVLGKGSQERIAFLSPATCEEIGRWLANRGCLQPGDAVFVTSKGAFRSVTINEVLKRLSKAAGVCGRVNPHSFRHAFARDWLLSGGDLPSLSQVLGHSDINTTRVYASFAVTELQELHRRHSPVGQRTKPNDSGKGRVIDFMPHLARKKNS